MWKLGRPLVEVRVCLQWNERPRNPSTFLPCLENLLWKVRQWQASPMLLQSGFEMEG